MPKLFSVGSYAVYFWSNENNEPIHVHVSTGKPSPYSTKIWLSRTGQAIVANNNSHIPHADLNKLVEIISAQFFMICAEWKSHFVVNEINFYC